MVFTYLTIIASVGILILFGIEYRQSRGFMNALKNLVRIDSKSLEEQIKRHSEGVSDFGYFLKNLGRTNLVRLRTEAQSQGKMVRSYLRRQLQSKKIEVRDASAFIKNIKNERD